MAHYHIINRDTNGTLSRVRDAPSEKSSDPAKVRDEKRKAEAQRKMGQWLQTYFLTRDANLIIIEVPSYD